MTYQQGLMWFLANDPRVPEAIRATSARGACRRTSSPTPAAGRTSSTSARPGGWSRDYVMTEHNCRGTTDGRGLGRPGRYTMDSHNCQRVVVDGHVAQRGRRAGRRRRAVPDQLPRRSCRSASECANLLVPVCLSASHIAYGSIRMEPVFMVLGQSAATAAALAIDAGVAVQEVDVRGAAPAAAADRLVLDGRRRPAACRWRRPSCTRPRPATVRVTLANDDIEPYENVELALAAPSGWTVEPAAPQAFDRVEPGGELEATWQVTATAADEPAAAHELRVRAAYAVAGTATDQEATEPVYVVEPVAAPYATFASTEAHFGARGDRLAIIAGGADVWVGIDQYGAVFRPAPAARTRSR